MDEITVETRRTSMYWCSNVLDNHGNRLESCGRNLLEFCLLKVNKKAVYRFSKYPTDKKLSDPPCDGKELLVDNWSMMGRFT